MTCDMDIRAVYDAIVFTVYLSKPYAFWVQENLNKGKENVP